MPWTPPLPVDVTRRPRSGRGLAALALCAGCVAPPADGDPVPADEVPVRSASAVAPDVADAAVTEGPPADWGGGFVALPDDPTRALRVDPGAAVDGRGAASTVAFFADLDGDGRDEVVTTTTPGDALTPGWRGRVQRWTDAGLVDDVGLTAALEGGGHEKGGAGPPLAALDLDGDGWIDLIGGSPDTVVRWGVGPGAFEGWTSLLPPGHREGGVAVGVVDLDDDGWLDLLLGGQGCDEPAFVALRTGPRTFALHHDALDGERLTARAFLATTLEDGEPLLYLVDDAAACDPDGRTLRAYRRSGFDDALRPRLDAVEILPPDGWWRALPEFVGQPFSALAPMGAGVEDLDADGFLDLVVTVGVTRQVILRGDGAGGFDDVVGAYARPSVQGKPEFPWNVAFPDVDLDGRPDVLWSVGDDQSSFLVEGGHPMRSALSWNDGALGLHDVDVGLDAAGSWHALGLADPDGDGDADVVLGGHGNPPVVYRDDVDVAGRRGLALRLVGTTGNRAALGARVEAIVGGAPTRTTVVGGVAGREGTSSPLVFLGALSKTAVDRVRITWPSGLVQEVDDLPVGGTRTVVEPPTIAVLDDDRRAPVRGCVDVVVTPRTRTGGIDGEGVAALRVLGTPASVAPASPGPGPVTFEVCGEEAGVSALEVRIDGLALRTRPKLWWEPGP